MSAAVCPACNKPLPASVVNGPPQAVVRCDGCQTLLLWSNGRVMRSAKSSTPTMMGMPAVQVPPKDPPLSALKPEGDAKPAAQAPPRAATQPMSRLQQPKASVTGLGDNVPTKVEAPPPELLRKAEPAKSPLPPAAAAAPKAPAASAPQANAPRAPMPTAATKPMAGGVPGKPMSNAPSKPNPVAPKPAAPAPASAAPSKPMGNAPSKPNPIAAKPAAPAATTPVSPAPNAPAGPVEDKPHVVVAAVAEVPSMSGGPMVDPSAWFAGAGDTSDVVPPERLPPAPIIESKKPPRGETTGAQPLPPPPALEPLKPLDIAAPGTEATPPVGTPMPAMRPRDKDPSAPIKVDKAPSQPIKVDKPAEKLPSMTAPRSNKSTVLGMAPLSPLKPEAKPEPKPEPRREAKAPAPAPVQPEVADADAPEPTPIEITEDHTPAHGMAEPALFPSSGMSLGPPPKSPAAPSAMANAPTLMADKEPSVQPLPPAPFQADASPTTPVAGESVLQPSPLRAPRFAMPALSTRVLVIGGAVVGAVLILVLALALRGPKAPVAPTVQAPAPPQANVETQPAPQPTPPQPAATPTPSPAPPAPRPSGAAVEPPAEAPPPSEAPPAPPRPRRTLGGKKVVLEYDPKPTSPTPPPATAPTPMGEDPATVARAREAYHKGNVKLFAGDTSGAIALYREALKIYPGYVAGYRGLGLGFEAAGNTDEALKAFQTYVKTVPSANDAQIIRRRIEHLESKK